MVDVGDGREIYVQFVIFFLRIIIECGTKDVNFAEKYRPSLQGVFGITSLYEIYALILREEWREHFLFPF